MDIDAIRQRVGENRYLYSIHADTEWNAEGLTLAHSDEALLAGAVVEDYPDTGRGEVCPVGGFADTLPIPVVCGGRGDDLVIVTVYIPRRPRWSDPWTRGGRT